MCSVLEFSSESDKLRTLFSESNHFDSVLFIFDGGRRYKVSSSSLGIHSPQDLLLPLGLGLFRSSPFWSYYLYPQGCNFHKGIDGLCGEVIRHTGSCVSEQSCHIFPDRSRSRLHILYRCDDEISACTAVIADLRWKLADLTRRLWGKSSEKRHLPEDAGQLSICFESPSDVNDPVAEEQKTAGKSVTSENGYNRFRKSFTKKITPHARKPIDPSLHDALPIYRPVPSP